METPAGPADDAARGGGIGAVNDEGALYLAVDGGGSKTDIALFDEAGRLAAFDRLGTVSPFFLGYDEAVLALRNGLSRLVARAGLGDRVLAAAALCLHGLDFPEDEATYAAAAAGMAPLLVVGNDMTGLLRSGVSEGWGIAVGCGSGCNAIGRNQAGRVARFLAFGPISGEFGGGALCGVAHGTS